VTSVMNVAPTSLSVGTAGDILSRLTGCGRGTG